MTNSFQALIASVAWLAIAQGRIYLAHADESTGCTFLGWFQQGSFVRAPELSSTDEDAYERAAARVRSAFPAGLKLFRIGSSGHSPEAIVRRTNRVEGLGLYSIEIDFAKGMPTDGTLLSTAPLPIRVLRTHSSVLPKSVDQQLRDRAEELWQKHLTELPPAPEAMPSAFRLGSPKVDVVDEVRSHLIVQYPVEFVVGESKDTRASFFFIYSLTDKRVIRGVFGHPEWARGSSVLTIKPEIYFTLKGGSRVFFVGTHEGGWEEWGHALFDLRTGRDLLFCY